MEQKYSYRKVENRVEEDAVLDLSTESSTALEKILVKMELPVETIQALEEEARRLGISRRSLIIRVIGDHLQYSNL